ncbi:MAG TPA: ribose 5-phosphate isomerase B [Candidatus Acidoferrum sp.]|nr:ribose 5-phosphate isomerase B [Candidatus Acidoferrum sp.]
MKIAIGADHAGFELKAQLVPRIEKAGHSVEDLGTFDETPVDYPDYAAAVGRSVLEGRAERGIMICGSGVGATVAANKLPGIRACVCHDTYSAHQGVEHDKMNVLVLGSRVIGEEVAFELVENFLAAKFSGEARHVRRLAKIQALEDTYMKARVNVKGTSE